MLTLLSPSKTLDFDSETKVPKRTQPKFKKDCLELVEILRGFSKADIASLMKVSEKLAQLNHERYQEFSESFSRDNSRPAITAFRGDVYKAFEDKELSSSEYIFAQAHIRILSGLYGVLRPLDMMQPYRLEMGTTLENPRGKNLVEFWGERVTSSIARDLKEHESKVILNLASKEYFSVIKNKDSALEIVTVHFKEKRGDKLKVIALNAKRARGLMARWIVEKEVDSPALLQQFALDGYRFKSKLSTESELVFAK